MTIVFIQHYKTSRGLYINIIKVFQKQCSLFLGQVYWPTFLKHGMKTLNISGWDEGALSMKLGEQSRIKIAAEKAYGKFGFEAWGYPFQTV